MKNNLRSTGLITISVLVALTVNAALAAPPVPKLRLPAEIRPKSYSADLTVLPDQTNFAGRILIDLELPKGSSFIWLHSHGLTVSNAYLEQKGRQIPAQPVVGSEEFLGFDLQQPAAAGPARLAVSYSGGMSEKGFAGLFRRLEGEHWYAATQLEATWARRVFPCFDEPSFKVPWRLALHVRRGHTALSNSPMVSEEDEPDGMKCVRFAETPPLPSYLLAAAVGPFEVVDLGKLGRKGTPSRIFTVKGKTNEASFASQAIPQLLRQLEEYYDLPYPYPKLDHVAVPHFEGAMENAGLITYGEKILLAPPDRETIAFKRACANVCAHEMAHQWFGDLVTMAWWDDTWLNEAFATWISPKMVDAWQPEWQTDLDQLLDTFGAVRADSLGSARYIRQPIQSEPDIDNAFDDITYSKGAAVLGMFESAIGQDTFRKAIGIYLKAHSWKNATAADFLAALNRAAKKNVGASFSTFLDQSGVPLVAAELGSNSNGPSPVLLRQKRYLPVGSTADHNQKWAIPLRLRYASGARVESLSLSLDKPEETVSLKIGPAGLQWLLLNHGAAGYYVSAYHGPLLSNLLQLGASKLSAAERMSLTYGMSAAVRSGDLPLGEALSLTPKLLTDSERRVVTITVGFLDRREIVPQELSQNYQRFVRNSLSPLIQGISWQPPRKETDDQRLQRLALLSLAANAGEDSRLIADAKRLATAWLDNRHAVPPDEAGPVLAVSGRYADAALFDRILTEARNAQDPTDRERLIQSLGSCKDPLLAERALEAIAAGAFPPDDSMRLLFALSGHFETRSLTYDYLKNHYSAVVAAIPGDLVFWYLPNLAQGFDTSAQQADVEAFFKDKDVKLTGGPRIIAQVLESIQLNRAFKEAQLPSLIEFLKQQ